MITRSDLQKIARARLRDVEVLYRSRRYDGAIYLCGYAVEIALKARICKTLSWLGYPSTGGEFQNYQRTVRSFSKANPKFDFWRAKKGRFWPKLRPKRTIYTAIITAHEPPSVVTIGLPTKNNFLT